MNRWLTFIALGAAVVMLAGCATMPTGPSVLVLPGDNKNFDQFRIDDSICRQYAYEQAGGAQQASQESSVTSAVVGTGLGAAAGAAIGSASGNFGSGAAIGAGIGLLLGSAYGTDAASRAYSAAQRRYDNAYMQCMYAKGNQIPGTRRSTRQTDAAPSGQTSYPPPAANYPPPPPDYSAPPYNERRY